MAESDASVQRTLGELLSAVKTLAESIREIKDEMRRSEEKSTESRRSMHARMDQIVTQVGQLEVSMAQAKADIAEMMPVTEEVRRWKLMGLGALGVVGIGGTALGVFLADTLDSLAKVFRGH